MKYIKPTLCIICIFLFMEFFGHLALEAASTPKITVILSSGIRPYKEAFEGFKKNCAQDVDLYDYKSNPKLIEHILKNDDHDILVAMGPQAARSIHSLHASRSKKIYLMVLDPERFSENGTLCGVDLRIPPETQLKEIRTHLGQGLKVGILYNEAANMAVIKKFQKSAGKLSMKLVGIPVKRPRDCIEALSRFRNEIDVLLFIPDPVVIKEALVQYILKQCILNGIMAVGYNHFFVENGAVLSLSVNYKETGALGARILKELREGRECALFPPPYTVEWNKKAWDTVKQRH